MAKAKKMFECQACGLVTPKWMGKCTSCGGWDSFIELKEEKGPGTAAKKRSSSNDQASIATSITEIEIDSVQRNSSYEPELDTVLGGGIVPGSLTLIGGSPGIGKSTLLLKIAGNLAQHQHPVLYVSGEESPGQIKMRANRLDANQQSLFLLSEIKLENILEELGKTKYNLVVIDSIQTIYSDSISSAPGSVTQVREITFELMRWAKDTSTAVFIIGHITKEGSIAGPRVLEHMVDTVLYFEGDSGRELRILRAFKNRFGSTSEIGIFEMNSSGLTSAQNISNKFFSSDIASSGSAKSVVLEGTRPIIIEVQALVSQSGHPNPKRSATGFETNRLNMLLALLEKKLELPLNQYDVFINVTGGIKITETAIDLAIIAAILSSFKNRPISNETIFIGEVSLIGDIREVYQMQNRLREAQTHGFKKAIVAKQPKESLKEIKCFGVDEVVKLIEWM
jgi:DNA repair protein RadA/Sms